MTASLSGVLTRMYDDGRVRNIHERKDIEGTVLRMDLLIRDSDVRRAHGAGDYRQLVDLIHGDLSRVSERHEAKAAYDLRPRPKLGAGTLGYARREAMTTYSFTVQGPPQPKQRARKGKGNRHYTPADTVRYESAVRAIGSLRKPPGWRTDGEYHLTVVAYFADYRAKDADNVGKAVSDALNKVAYDDDNQVVKATYEKAVDPSNPRTEVTVQWVGERVVKARKRKAVA